MTERVPSDSSERLSQTVDDDEAAQVTRAERRAEFAERRAVAESDRAEVAEGRAAAADDRLRTRTTLLGAYEHKLKSALAIISGWAASLDARWDDYTDAQRRSALGAIRRQADDLGRRAESLVEETRAEITGLNLDPEPIDLAELLQLEAELFDGSAPGHEVAYDGPATLQVHVDAVALQQVVAQLIENAIKYSAAPASIVIGLRTDEERVCITVQDDGVGVPEGIAVFEPFQRGPATGVAGSGLGLYIVNGLVEAMGGTVSAARNPRAGSTFTLDLPRDES
ncbi:MAG: multi-sensor signal transduction histidine kinase [Acidimicrobiales bacterium]|jgi:signal transduction histidine kinase|nr:multi-sensor signal transduction histidine kinase [Acidimicrobiales bacterium]